jgi:hypothetical protein
MSSESVCQIARSWVDVGRFHTRLFGVVYFAIASVREFMDTPSYMYTYIYIYICVSVCVYVCILNYSFINKYGLPLFRNLYNFALRTALNSSVGLVTRYRVGRQ